MVDVKEGMPFQACNSSHVVARISTRLTVIRTLLSEQSSTLFLLDLGTSVNRHRARDALM